MLLRLLVLFVYFIKITYQGSTSFINTESYHTLLRSKRQSESHCVLPDHPANGEFKLYGHEQNPYLPNSNTIPNTIIDLSCMNGAVTQTGGPFRAICYQGKWKPSLSQAGGCVLLKEVHPCNPSPCGPNSQCWEINERAICSCLPGNIGTPPSCRPKCVTNFECPSSEACVNQKCQDPCPGSCGILANCQVVNHTPICSCPPQFAGDPFIQCRILKEVHLCNPSPCGPNFQCREMNEQAICSCLPGYIGTPPSCRPECVTNFECPSSEDCVNQKCIDPCPGSCGILANCQVVNHTPICRCPPQFAGDPFIQCRNVIKITSQKEEFSETVSRSQDACFLPDHPANGKIKILGQEQEPYLPNSDVIPNTIIDLSCTNGTVTETGGLSRAICYQGKWKPSQIGGCARRCPQVQTEGDTVLVNCVHKNPGINCSNPVEGTVIQLVCKPFYKVAGSSPIITCRNGAWDRAIPPCQAECGKARVVAQPLVVGGFTAIKSKYPWVAAIYMSYSNLDLISFIGGATVLSRYFVLSAAHLFTKDGNLSDTNLFIVAAGKHYRDFGNQNDTHVQSSRIERIYVPETYSSSLKTYGASSLKNIGDLAILKLKDPFTFTEHVQPVCIDWTNQYETSDLKEDNKGVFAGWGLTKKRGKVDGSLQILDVPYKSNRTCPLPLEYKGLFYTYDKFCAGDNQTSVCYSDEGGGLFFRSLDDKFYIRGILSITPEYGMCDRNFPGLYTKISTYLPEIEKEVGRLV